ncbi:MAG: HNH endonuclease [Bacteroidota bacterium]
MPNSTLWTREELIIALNLYWKTPYNKISGSTNSEIKDLAKVIGRTPASIAYKLMNFTSLDAERQKKGNKGKESAGKLDEIIWNEYHNDWERLAIDSVTALSKIQQKPIESFLNLDEDVKDYTGTEKERIIKTRINQYDFRRRILASYNGKCCISGIDLPNLLVASHIIPWSVNETERLNPRNGLCLNYLHDRAFDTGLITITPEFRVRLSSKIKKSKKSKNWDDLFLQFEDKLIELPDRFMPDIQFLIWHNHKVFEKGPSK